MAALLMALLACWAQAEVIDPARRLAPEIRVGPRAGSGGSWSGTRDYEPGGSMNNLFIGGYEDRAAAAAPASSAEQPDPAADGPLPELPPPQPLTPKASGAFALEEPAAPPAPPEPAAAREPAGARAPSPEERSRLAEIDALLAAEDLGPRQTLASLGAVWHPADPARVQPADPSFGARAAPARAVKPGLPGDAQALPAMSAAPAHEAPAYEPKAVELENVDLRHNAIPDLIELLKTGSPKLRARAADELGRRGREAAPALPALQASLKSEHARLRSSAALALGNIGGDAKALKRLLRPLLKDASADVRASAETALARLRAAPF